MAKRNYADATEVTWSDVLDAFAQLGIDPVDAEDVIHEVTIAAGKITVIRYRQDKNGDPVIAGREPATVTTIIGVEFADGDGA